tara:strand:- start:1195 stop:1971 length:777 start_codon:yes stop_codon:yes gene_type:complete
MKRYSNDNNNNNNNNNDVTRIGWRELIKDNNTGENSKRFESNIFINKKENYENSNQLINSLTEELLTLKRKMKFVYEKDEEIQSLKNKITEYQNDDKNLNNKYKNENIALKLALSSLEEKNKEYLKQIDSFLLQEKKEEAIYENIKQENKKLKKENSILKRELNLSKEKIYNKRDRNDDNDEDEDDDDDDDYDDIDFDVEVKVKEKVKVDIQKLKKILSKKLENKRDDKIEELLKRYDIKDQREIDKNIIEGLIRKII